MTETEYELTEKQAPLPAIATPNDVIMAAVQKGYKPEFIEKMMDLAERFEKNEARKAYVKAMAKFKADPPEILKTAHVSYVNAKGQKVEWDHAVLGEVGEAIIAGLSPHGFYHRWDMEQPDNNTVKTTCILTHALGHSEQVSMSGPPDTSGGKDALKAVSSTNTLLQRLTLLAVTGLAAKGMDVENPPDLEFITEAQAKEINDLLKETSADVPKFLKVAKAESVKTISSKMYPMLIKQLKDKKHFQSEKAKEPGQEG